MPDHERVRDNREASRFELVHDGRTSVLTYARSPGRIRLIHTEVPLAQRGEGLGTRLVEFALAAAREAGEQVVPQCPFVVAYLREHPSAGAND
jgi:uncharacterized protein